MASTEKTNSLSDSVITLSGIGPKKAETLAKSGIHILNDLLSILPRTYQLRTQRKIKELEVGMPAIIVAKVLRAQFTGRAQFRRMEILVKDESGLLKLVFFNPQQMSLENRFAPDNLITILGSATTFANSIQMAHPRVYNGDIGSSLEGLWPVYPDVKGIYPAELAKLIQSALKCVQENPPRDIVPESIKEQARLCSLLQAYQTIHHPNDQEKKHLEALVEQTHPAFRRIAFEEILSLQLVMQRRRLQMTQHLARTFLKQDPQTLFEKLMPFRPTQAQTRVLTDMINDLARPYPMMRLLQGDVGAGKTAVAACCAFIVAQDAKQVAIMVPTEILAKQHYQSLLKILAPHDIKVILLTGSLGKKDRDAVLSDLKQHARLVVIGTHALISEDVEFKNLSLIIIDEQHRFGVEQRTLLVGKGKNETHIPHQLAMTATPIPRSLALTMYGDFAISVLDELPPGRTPIVTRILRGEPTQIIQMLSKKIMDKGEQGYIVYPLVEESEKLDLQDAKRAFDMLAAHFGKNKIALVHGRMKALEKNEMMAQFVKGDVPILISTTVIEVGVDVPNATNMIIVHAERFGLSQLHQLRGRVGRGAKNSFCFLVTEKLFSSDEAYHRLSLMEKTTDGFIIASEDLKMRGPGDFLGTRQSGLPLFRFCDLSKHGDLVEYARTLAIEITNNDH